MNVVRVVGAKKIDVEYEYMRIISYIEEYYKGECVVPDCPYKDRGYLTNIYAKDEKTRDILLKYALRVNAFNWTKNGKQVTTWEGATYLCLFHLEYIMTLQEDYDRVLENAKGKKS